MHYRLRRPMSFVERNRKKARMKLSKAANGLGLAKGVTFRMTFGSPTPYARATSSRDVAPRVWRVRRRAVSQISSASAVDQPLATSSAATSSGVRPPSIWAQAQSVDSMRGVSSSTMWSNGEGSSDSPEFADVMARLQEAVPLHDEKRAER